MEKEESTVPELQRELAELRSQLAEYRRGGRTPANQPDRLAASPEEDRPQREPRFQELVDLLPEIVFELDARGVVTFVNRQGLAYTGYSPEDLQKGFEGIDLFVAEDHPRIKRTIMAILAGEPSAPAEYTARKKNGETFPALTHSAPIWRDNKIVGIRGLVINLTRHERSKRRIAQINRLQEELLGPGTLEQKTGRITDGVVEIFNADFARIWINKPGDRCETGCVHAVAEEGPHRCTQRQHCLHLVASSGRYTHLDGEVHQRVPFGCCKIGRIASGEVSSFYTNKVPQDPWVHNQKWAEELGLVSFVGYRLLSTQSTPLGVLGLFSRAAISEEEMALLKNLSNTAAHVIQAALTEGALRVSEARYRQLVEHSPFGIAVLDAEDRLVEANPRFLALTGATPEALQGRPLIDLWTDQDEQEACAAVLRQVETSRTERVELVLGDRTIKMSATMIRQTPPLKVVMIEDITEERGLADQLRQAQKMEAIGSLAGGVAHDINNMLAVIMALSSVLKVDIDPDSPLQEDLADILSACDRGQALTSNLLGFARQGKYRQEELSLNQIAEQVISLLKRTIPKQIIIEAELDPDLGIIEGDNNQINQVLVNLALNGVDAMEDGGTLSFRTTNTTLSEGDLPIPAKIPPGPYVRLDIRDTGVGMTPGTCRRAFDPFFTTKPVGQGTGLGLSMVYGTIKNHDGVVLLDSAPEQGTTVTIYLPVHRPEGALVREPTREYTSIQTGSGTILLVDDEKLIRQVGGRLLEKLGYEVLLAEDGLQAIKRFQEHRGRVDLILLDLIMPNMSGEEAFLQLKEIDPEVKILLSSGYTQEKIADKMFSLGVAGFVQKPYQLSELSAKVASAIHGSPQEPT